LVEKYPGLQWDNPDIIEWGAVTATEQTEQGPTGDVYTDYAREYAREQSRKHAHNIHRTRPK
jgi:hypothetical protein